MKQKLLRVLLALLLIAVIILIAGFVFLDREAWISSNRLSAALEGARKVVLVEYAGDVVIARKIATNDEMARLQSATSVWPRPFVPAAYLCFVPHHSVEIVRADGSAVKTAICFLCQQFSIENGPASAPLPSYLGKPLASFFTSVGMAPKTSEEYTDLELSRKE